MSPRGYWLNEFETKCEDTGRESARQAGAVHATAIRQFIEKGVQAQCYARWNGRPVAEALGDVSDDAEN
jgi:hypothetical protein